MCNYNYYLVTVWYNDNMDTVKPIDLILNNF